MGGNLKIHIDFDKTVTIAWAIMNIHIWRCMNWHYTMYERTPPKKSIFHEKSTAFNITTMITYLGYLKRRQRMQLIPHEYRLEASKQ